MLDNMKFELLANCIKEINVKAGSAAKRTVNQSVTLLNWAIELLYFLNMNKVEVIVRNMGQTY